MSETNLADPQLRAFEAFLEFVEETERVLHISMYGISRMSGMTRLSQALRHSDEIVAHSAKYEAMAEKEVASGFPLLHAHSVVAIWSALEAAIPQAVIDWIVAFPKALQGQKFQKIKIPVSSYEMLSAEDRAKFVIEELMQSLSFDLKLGIGRFESLLDAVGLSGPVPETINREIFEMSQVRNLVVHRFSTVDAKFLKACPWIQIAIGDRLRVSPERFHDYRKASREYAALVAERILAAIKDAKAA